MSFRCLIAFATLFTYFATAVNANEQQVQVSYLYHSDQQSGSGFQVGYHYFINENLAATLSFQQSGDLRKRGDGDDIWQQDNYQAVDIGVLGRKAVNDRQYFYYGAGLSYLTSADTELLFESSELAPFLKVGTGFKLSPEFAIDIGVNQHFSLGALNSAPAIYLGVNYRFGHKANTYTKSNNNKHRETNTPQKLKPILDVKPTQSAKPTIAEISKSSPINTNTAAPKNAATITRANSFNNKSWAIQLGAYTQMQNANAAIKNLRQSMSHELSIAKVGNYFKVVIPFKTREAAKKLLVTDPHVKGFIIKLDDKKLQLLPHE